MNSLVERLALPELGLATASMAWNQFWQVTLATLLVALTVRLFCQIHPYPS